MQDKVAHSAPALANAQLGKFKGMTGCTCPAGVIARPRSPRHYGGIRADLGKLMGTTTSDNAWMVASVKLELELST